MRIIKLIFLFLTSFLFSCKGQVPDNRPHIENPKFDKKVSQTISFSIPTIGVEALKEMDEVVILDAREKKEFKVSHIPNARFIGYNNFKLKNIQDLPKDTPIVLYCSIGYRSEKIGQKLQKAGYSNIQNLYGSIFEWVNQGNEVVNENGETTKKVHTYNKNWSKWVEEGKAEKVW